MPLTPAEEFLLSYQKEFFWTVIASGNGTHLAPRACFLQYKPDFGFYIIAKNFTKKFEQIKANPYVTLSLSQVQDNNIPVFHATCRVTQDKSDVDKAWFDKLTEFGYTGKDDSRLVVFVFTIHSATFGQKKYEGVPYDYTKLKVVGDAPLPPLPEGPYQTAEGLAVLKKAWKDDARNWHLFTYGGLQIHDRLMQLNFNDNAGFYFVTGASSDKAKQLTGNPNVALLLEQKKDNVQIAVDGLLHRICCSWVKEATWDAGFQAFGFKGFDDPNYAVYKLVVRKVVVHSFTPESPKTYQFEPTAYDRAAQLLYTAYKTNAFWSLATVDEHNVPHSRTMGLIFHSTLGFFMGGRRTTDKFKQIAYKDQAALNLYLPASKEDYQVQVSTRAIDCDAVRYATFSDRMKAVGYTGPDDKAFVPFVFNILSITYSKNFAPTSIKVRDGPGAGGSPYFLGFDSSTQSFKALVINAVSGAVAASALVIFGKDLPEYKSPDGVLANADPLVKHANPLMWLAALDLALKRLVEAGAPLSQVRGISGSGQQHGSVYLNSTAAAALAHLDPAQSLAAQLGGIFARATSPIWMDSSTGAEVAELNKAIGQRLQDDTGSPGIERFTGPQIRRFFKTEPAAYEATVRIHLVSSFVASVLIGGDAPIDRGDGAGMNLLNLRTGEWDAEIADATAPGLIAKLPPVGKTGGVAGKLAPYFAKYGLTVGIPVALWTGDNPASLIGAGAHRAGKGVVSLGTSDTVFAALDRFHTDPAGFGHVFGNPAGGTMSLACFKNGSLARDRVRSDVSNGWTLFGEKDWSFFDKTAFEQTPAGNEGRLALPWYEQEITPLGSSIGLRQNFEYGTAPPAVRVRAAVEGQVLSRALHSAWVGQFSTLRVTGGASKSRGILQTLADVFQAKVERIAVTDSAALGAALIAAHVAGGFDYDALAEKFCPTVETVLPHKENAAVYKGLLPKVQELESK